MPGFTTCLLQIVMDGSLNTELRLSGRENTIYIHIMLTILYNTNISDCFVIIHILYL